MNLRTRLLLLVLICAGVVAITEAQTRLAKRQVPAVTVFTDQANTYSTGAQDFESATVTRPFRRLAFASFPGTCTANREFLERSDPATAGQVVYVCNAAGTGWDLVGDGGAGGSVPSPGANGMVACTGTACSTSAARTITGTTNQIAVTNGDGVAGNPTLDIGANVILAASTHTLTNKTLDVEATGNSITTVSKIWLEAGACQNASASLMWDTPTTNPAVAACITGTNTQKGVADFADGAASLSMQRTLVLPADFAGAVDVKFKWLTTAITGDVVWQIATICVADAETDDPAFNTASTVTDTAKGTANQTNDASITGITMTGCAAGEAWHIKVLRDPAHASDTLAATARLLGVELTVRRAQ